MEAFLCFFDEDMLRMIIKHTNKYGENYKGNDNWSPVDLDEIKGIIGLLFVMEVYRSQHESLRSMWSSGPSGRAIFPTAFKKLWLVFVLTIGIRACNGDRRTSLVYFAAFGIDLLKTVVSIMP